MLKLNKGLTKVSYYLLISILILGISFGDIKINQKSHHRALAADGITISGTIYSNENKTSNIGAGKTIGLSINGGAKTTLDTLAGGVFEFTGIEVAANETVTIFIDDEEETANLVTQVIDDITNITNLEMYANKIVLRHETAGPMTNLLLDTADDCGDDDLFFSVSAGEATFDSNFELWIEDGMTYTPFGNVSADDLEIRGGATFNPDAFLVILDGSLNIAGSLTGVGNVAVNGGSVTGDGDIDFAGGTFVLDGNGNFGGATDWIFYNLTFGDGVGQATTSKLGANKITAKGELKISLNQRLEAGSGTWDLSWSKNQGALTDISKIAGGETFSLALKSDGSRIYAWGWNYNGQLGDDTTTQRETPVLVKGVGGVGYLGDGVNGGPISEIAGGESFSMALKSDGSRVYTWGNNYYGQLGDDTTDNHHAPVVVKGLSGTGYLGDGVNGGPISAISAGNTHSMALKSDQSRVYTWGCGSNGRLGDNTTSHHHVPIEVKGVNNLGNLGDGVNGGPISAISAGSKHSMALKSDGSRVYAWGYNWTGQLGDNTQTQRLTPIMVKGVNNLGNLGDGVNGGPISAISAGTYGHSMALKTGGSRVYAWGWNGNGQLGDNTDVQRNVPIVVKGMNNIGYLGDGVNGGPITAIKAAGFHSLALKSDNSRIYAWGSNYHGKLGDGTGDDHHTPIMVKGIDGNGYLGDGVNGGPISMMAVGETHTLALKSDQTRIYAWGENTHGRLGDDTTTDRYIPVLTRESEAVPISTSLFNLGDISQVAAGDFYTLALKSDGSRVYAWGDNNFGNLGDNSTIDRITPIMVKGLSGNGYLGDGVNGGPISMIAAGVRHSMALKSDGSRVYAWGNNADGQLGDNTTDPHYVPIEVKGLSGNGFLGDGVNGGPISKITGGGFHSLALKSDQSRVYAWGWNDYGQLGDNTTDPHYVPVEVKGVDGNGFLGDEVNGGPIKAISCGYMHSMALKLDGSRVYAWGDNDSGRLGDNTTDQRNAPIQVKGIDGNGFLGDGVNGGPISAISAAGYYSMALKLDGTRVYSWGQNWHGQLGDGTTDDHWVPIMVKGIDGNGFLGDGVNGGPISMIAGGDSSWGDSQSLALKSDGTRVYAWGNNWSGQLGDDTIDERDTPIMVKGIDGNGFLGDGVNGGPISMIEGSRGFSLALKSDNSVIYEWGNNGDGQLGDGTVIERHTPVEVIIPGFNAFTIEGTFVRQSSTIKYSGNYNPISSDGHNFSPTIIAPTSYYDLTIDQADEVFFLTGTTTVNGDLTISDGQLLAFDNQLLIKGNYSNSGVFNSGTSTVIFDGSGAQSITCGGTGADYQFYNLTITNHSSEGVNFDDSCDLIGTFTDNTPGSRVTFHAGATYTFPAIDINGSASNHIVFKSDSPGNSWMLIVSQADPEVSYVDVKDSDASIGNEITNNGGRDLDNNDNWYFIGSDQPLGFDQQVEELPYTGM